PWPGCPMSLGQDIKSELQACIKDAFTLDEVRVSFQEWCGEPLDNVSMAPVFESRIADLVNWAHRQGRGYGEKLGIRVGRAREGTDVIQSYVRRRSPRLKSADGFIDPPDLPSRPRPVDSLKERARKAWPFIVVTAALTLIVGTICGTAVAYLLLRPAPI